MNIYVRSVRAVYFCFIVLFFIVIGSAKSYSYYTESFPNSDTINIPFGGTATSEIIIRSSGQTGPSIPLGSVITGIDLIYGRYFFPISQDFALYFEKIDENGAVVTSHTLWNHQLVEPFGGVVTDYVYGLTKFNVFSPFDFAGRWRLRATDDGLRTGCGWCGEETGSFGPWTMTLHYETPPQSFTVDGKIVDWVGNIDIDGDGYYDTFSFKVQVKADVSQADAFTWAKVTCTTTNEEFYMQMPTIIESEPADGDLPFLESTFTNISTSHTALDFKVELYDRDPRSPGAVLLATDTNVQGGPVLAENPSSVDTRSDSDNDGMPNFYENYYTFLWSNDPTDAAWDADTDGLTNLGEYQRHTKPDDRDTDDDGMWDGYEAARTFLNPLLSADGGWDYDVDALTNREEYDIGTNPADSDSDDDGIPDGWEVDYGLNPLSLPNLLDSVLDYDIDGLTNLKEYQLGTNPRNTDTDSDVMPDAWEVNNSLNPRINDANLDPDADGRNNQREFWDGTNPRVAEYLYTLTATTGNGGSINPSSATVFTGRNQTFNITPQTGYHITDVTVDGVSQGAITSYTFTDIRANHTITASFAINTYVITATAGTGGTVTPSSATVNYGGSQAFTITPGIRYQVATVKADGVSKGAVTSYTFTNVTAGHTLTASFALSACANLPVRIVRATPVYFSSLQAAYNAAVNGDVIQSQAQEFVENLSANRNISVTIDGGYACSYASNPEKTMLKGATSITSGTVNLKNFVLQ